MKNYKTLSLIFSIVAICLFITGIITATKGGDSSTGLVFIPCGFIFLMQAIIFRRKEEKSEKKDTPEEKPLIEEPEFEEPTFDEPVTTTVRAEVIDMVCGTGLGAVIDHKTPRATRYFLIKFKTDEGAELEFEVEEEVYLGFDVGMKGDLTYFDEQIYGFEPTNE